MKTRKRVVIDARVVLKNRGHGIARHTEELIANLMSFQPVAFDIILLVNQNSPYCKMPLPWGFSFRVMKTSWLNLLNQLELPYVLWKLKPDLFHSPSFMVPLLSSAKLLATIHDLNHVALSENYSIMHRIYYHVFLPFQIKRAKAIITVSEFSKKEIINFFKVNDDKVRVIYNGISEKIFPHHTSSSFLPAELCMKYDLPPSYILSVGNKKPHKNMRRLVEAYCSGDFTLPLVLLSEFDIDILKIAESYHKKHKIYFVRFVSDDDVHALYWLAKVFVFPSLYEGFGLPPLEAAACGVPVVVSQCSSLPEIMQNAAIYVNPESVESIRNGIRDAFEKESLVAENVRNGLEIVGHYSWQKMSQETYCLYSELLNGE